MDIMIAIQGDNKRGQEVINCLERLGGVNYFEWDGWDDTIYYYIDQYGCISCYDECVDKLDGFPIHNYILYTLDEYLDTLKNKHVKTDLY